MKPIKLVPLMLLAACSSGPSQQDALRAFAATSQAMSSAQSSAVQKAQTNSNATGSLALDFSGPCAAGGTVGVKGSFDGDDTTQQAAFDMTVTFDTCNSGAGTIDGALHWAASQNGSSYDASMDGSIDFSDAQGAFTCDYDFTESVATGAGGTNVTYSGSLCGLDVNGDLHVGANGT